jgi:uncharacterized membrane protein
MKPERLNAFSDGVIAIITIMVLELKIPRGADLSDLIPLIFSYVLSFAYIAIYWNNHHHMMNASARVDGSILWANMNLLFWLSLIPFATGWMGANDFARIPTATYGLALLMPAIAYFLLERAIIRQNPTPRGNPDWRAASLAHDGETVEGCPSGTHRPPRASPYHPGKHTLTTLAVPNE